MFTRRHSRTRQLLITGCAVAVLALLVAVSADVRGLLADYLIAPIFTMLGQP